MKKIELILDDGDNPKTITIDKKKIPIDAFFLTTSVKKRDSGHFLAYGSSDDVGTMIYSFYKWSIKESPEMAYVLEAVAKDIVAAAAQMKGPQYIEIDEDEDENITTH
jgi:hypothetical protein